MSCGHSKKPDSLREDRVRVDAGLKHSKRKKKSCQGYETGGLCGLRGLINDYDPESPVAQNTVIPGTSTSCCHNLQIQCGSESHKMFLPLLMH